MLLQITTIFFIQIATGITNYDNNITNYYRTSCFFFPRTEGLEFTQRTPELRLKLNRFLTGFGRSKQRLSHLQHHRNQDSLNFHSVFAIIVEASDYHPPAQSGCPSQVKSSQVNFYLNSHRVIIINTNQCFKYKIERL